MDILTNPEFVIVGGGISGLLLALRLSRDPKKRERGIHLIEKQPQLGGRFFFSSTFKFTGKNSEEISQEINENAFKNLYLSGPGFESMEAGTLEALYRHVESHLTEDEKNQIEEILIQDNSLDFNKINKCYIVKKEFVSEVDLFSGSSEIFTKKDSELFKSLVFDFYNSNHLNEDNNSQAKDFTIFEKSTFWNECGKGTKETFAPILTSLVGPQWEKATFQYVCKALYDFFSNHKNTIPPSFFRKKGLEFAIEKILRHRGVIIRTLCEVVRVHYNKVTKFQLLLSDEIQPLNKILKCSKLILAIPLVKCLGLLPKENFSPSQSRFVSKVRPVSLVISEISDFLSVKSEQWPEQSGSGDRLVFPVERAQGFVTHDGRILFSTKLEYEESLQAPSVREAISRLRRAAARVLKSEFAEEFKKGARIPQNKLLERIVLLPVAFTIPCDMSPQIEVKETKMGIEGLYCCGDSFPGFASEPWKMVVSSVHDVAMQLNS
ncbi:NAD(P)-binding protein [Silvanigrella aquatica]|uniref:Amine oxidase domain-containing protein n=1 Tax=Silvanigrella aquatica TaxID=1915309 RepID=A0A1L4CZS1_9BACT|nr:FAD/NAD(P)-binding protein [Silvanigrella aquatica]APJ03454.1 hypothetical protein AXG55_05860 [Silvanigrella aquatica]